MNRKVIFTLVCLLLFARAQAGYAVDSSVKLNDLVTETQKDTPDPDEMTLVWWMPNEYWEVSLRDDPEVTPEAMKSLIDAVGAHTIIAAVDGRISDTGVVKYKPDAEVRASISIVDASGQVYRPMAAAAIKPDAREVIDAMKPMIANMLGPMGKSFNFYVFTGKNKQGQRLLDPTKEGRFSVKLGTREFKWKLPLGSLLPAKTCPKCSETLSGAYKFCPYDGTELPGPAKSQP